MRVRGGVPGEEPGSVSRERVSGVSKGRDGGAGVHPLTLRVEHADGFLSGFSGPSSPSLQGATLTTAANSSSSSSAARMARTS